MALRWRLCADLEPRDGPTNMATDQALLEAVAAGAPPILRLYRWGPPTLSFGRNQPAAGLYDEAAAGARRIAFVRRPTGGQAVLHADELTYAVIAPVAVVGRPRDAYRRINEALVSGLRAVGVAAEVAGRAAVGSGVTDKPAHTHARSRGWAAACFREPAEGEVVVGGRKLVGSAQRCEGRVILQHGSVLVSGSQAAAEELLVGTAAWRDGPNLNIGDQVRAAAFPDGPIPDSGGQAPFQALAPLQAMPAGWTTLADHLPARPAWPALAAAIARGFEDTIGTALARAGLSTDESARAETLYAHFASPAWTWRR